MAKVLGMRETELCLGLPGGSGGANNGGGGVVAGAMKSGKRGRFPHSVDLKLKLDSSLKDFFGGVAELDSPTKSPVKPPAKAQVVGWPPVRSYRKNTMATTHKTTSDANNTNTNDKKDNDNVNKDKKSANTTAATTTTVAGGGLLKVSIDGAPYLRKVDLKLYHSYKELLNALGNLFSAFAVPPGNYNEAQGMIDFMNERKLMNLLNSSEFVPTYEDKDGDWMLVGDVPWDMFVDSCKRLRIMKGSDAIGLAPRATEKCKKRS